MSTEATGQASVAAPPATAQPAVTPVVETQAENVELGDGGLPMDIDQIDKFFVERAPIPVAKTALEVPAGQESKPVETAAPSTTAPVTQPPAGGATPPPVTAAPVTTTTDEEGEGRILPRKINTTHFDNEGQRAIALQHTLNKNGEVKPGDAGYVTLRDAMGQLETHDARKPAAAAATPTNLEALQTKATKLNEDLATLRQQRAEMAGDEKFLTSDYDALSTKIEDTMRDISKAERELENEQATEAGRTAATQNATLQAAKTAREKALDAATAKYPGLRDPATPIGARAAKLYEALKVPTHPDFDLLKSTNAAAHLGRMAVEELATEMSADGKMTYAEAYASLLAKPAAAAVPGTQPPASPLNPPKVLPASGGATSVPPVGQQTQQMTEAEMLAKSMEDPSIIDDVLYPKGDKPKWVIGG